MNGKKYTNQITGLIVMVLGIAYYIQSFSIKVTRVGGDYNSRMFPQLIGVVFISMGLLLALRDIRSLLTKKRSAVTQSEVSDATMASFWARYRKVVFIFLISFAYVAFMMVFGYLLTTPIFMFVFMIILTPKSMKHRYVLNAVIAIASSLVFFVMFRYGFTMILPRGIF